MQTVFPAGHIPHPLLSIHVRHGDKYKEMELHDLPDFVKTAEENGIFTKARRESS